MEFSFEYFDFLKSINNNTLVIQSIAYIGILLLYIPYRALGLFSKKPLDGKMQILGFFYFFITWVMGAVIIGIMQVNDQPGIKLVLVWITIASTNLAFLLKNSTRLYKAYERFKTSATH